MKCEIWEFLIVYLMDNVMELGEFFEGVFGYCFYYGYVSVIVCFIGIVFNVINVVIWFSKNMRLFINFILIMLVIIDIVFLFMYFVYVVYFFFVMGLS